MFLRVAKRKNTKGKRSKSVSIETFDGIPLEDEIFIQGDIFSPVFPGINHLNLPGINYYL